MKIDKYLKNITPRKYQKDIYKSCKENNCLVVLPTGLGKTLISLMLTINRMIRYPEKKILFLAPTRPLINQHLNYFKKHLPELFADMKVFTGKTKPKKRMELWKKTDIIFSTPQCISNDLKKGLYSLKNVSLLVEDESHRCFKNYSYTYIAEKYKQQGENKRILGLTASPGHDKDKLKKICENLSIEKIEMRTRDSEDVKEYLEERKFETIKVDFPEEFDKIRKKLKKIYDKKLDELKSRKLLFGRKTKRNLLQTQNKIMRAISSGNKHFNLLAGASAAAMALKLQHSLELLETQTLSSFQKYIQKLEDEAEKKKSKAVQKLVKKQEFNQARRKLNELIKKREHPKVEKLKEVVKEDNTKIMVFCQYRNTAVKLCGELNKIERIKARIFVGQAKKKDTGLTQKEQKKLLRKFESGEVNLLVSTSVGEEGLDISEMGHVIFYEPIPSAIRTIQRRGRTARLKPGKITFLITKGTRDEAYYWASFNKEKKMHKSLEKIKEDLEKGKINAKEKQTKLK